MYVCPYTYLNIFIDIAYMPTHTYRHTFIHTYVDTYMCVLCVFMPQHIYIYAHAWLPIYMYIYAYIYNIYIPFT